MHIQVTLASNGPRQRRNVRGAQKDLHKNLSKRYPQAIVIVSVSENALSDNVVVQGNGAEWEKRLIESNISSVYFYQE